MMEIFNNFEQRITTSGGSGLTLVTKKAAIAAFKGLPMLVIIKNQ